MNLNELHGRFLREREYLDNIAPKTLKSYHWGWNAFTRAMPEVTEPGQLDSKVAGEFVIRLREAGKVKTVSVNSYIRSLNVFFGWLRTNEFITEAPKLKTLRNEILLPKTVARESLAKLIGFRPTAKMPMYIHRVHAVIVTIIDTGLRVNEVITLRSANLDMDQLVLRVLGKGRRERLIPFSVELRRVLFRYISTAQADTFEFVFAACDSGGLTPVLYRNLLRDYDLLCRKIGIAKPGGFHRLRHTFATAFMRQGGNQFHLKAILGHSTIKTTDIYVHADVESLRSNRGLLANRSMR